MSILNKNSIRDLIKDGSIIFTGPKENIKGVHVDVTLSHTLYKAVKPSLFTRFCYWWIGQDIPVQKKFKEVPHSKDGTVTLKPGQLYLGSTYERVGSKVPEITTSFHTRSTLARHGIMMHLGAGWGDPGYASQWTLEIYNMSKVPVKIKTGTAIGCVAFTTVVGDPVELYESKYTAYNYQERILPKEL